MCSQITLNQITSKIVQAAKDCLGSKLEKVILYGSYARGDYDAQSDVDIMILADIPREEANRVWDQIWDITGDIALEYGVMVSIHVKDSDTFYKFINDLPFYSNVMKDGVILSA